MVRYFALLYLAAVAVGALVGSLGAACLCLTDRGRTRRDIRHLEAQLRDPAVIARYSRKEKPQP
ncbi:hypothetical protein ACFY0F_23770 [Streptomyces sp. NPDC001544]|uniref:hypothetical protein n=1 Tax=Streptomyces sp. NPDC001544 TaxID=3364584 RepID=UPI0036A3CAAC